MLSAFRHQRRALHLLNHFNRFSTSAFRTMASYPPTIQALTIAKTGDFEVLEKTTQPFPTVEPGQIVVKVDYFGINFIDTYYRKGLYPIKSFPAGLGVEAGGTLIGLPTDEATLNDPDYQKRNYKVGDKVAINVLGVHSDYAVVKWPAVYSLPPSVTPQIGAAALLQGLTAVTFIHEAYDVQKGDIIFVHTLAGGLGLILTQLIKARGATVIGTTSTEEKAALAKENGADHVILYTKENTVERVLEITKGEGVHAIFDGVGKDTFMSNFDMIRRKGTIITLGNASGAVPPFSPLKLVEKNVKLLRPTMGNYLFTPEERRHYGDVLWPVIVKGDLKIRIFKEYPFTTEGAQQAQKDLTGGKTVGKLLIKVD